jgi:hypothetical protein
VHVFDGLLVIQSSDQCSNDNPLSTSAFNVITVPAGISYEQNPTLQLIPFVGLVTEPYSLPK